MSVAAFGFQGVADRVSEVEDAAQAGFALVGGDDLGASWNDMPNRELSFC